MNDTISTRYPADEPRQFWWSVLIALLAWLIIVFIFGRLLSPPKADMAPPLPIDAQIIELPEPKPLPPIVQTPRPPEPPAAPKPIAKPQVKQIPIPRSSPAPAPESPPVDRPVEKAIEKPSAQASPEAPQTPAPSSAPVAPSPNISAGSARMGAKAIYQPLPNIPDDLRDEAIKAVAVARFHINPDGTATVELIKPTANPRINQILLNTLKTWKFFPALQDGKPIPSSQDIKVNVNVS
jgi:periplasmic protein TonB